MRQVQPLQAVALTVCTLLALTFPIVHPAQTATSQPKELQLSFGEFDQSPQSGWRRLQYEGKYAEAAQLIDLYEKGKEGLNGGDRIVLCFHAAQMYAFAGDYETALARLKNAKYPHEVLAQAGEDRFLIQSWNLYVDSTIAFLMKDRDALRRCLALMEKEPKDQMLQQNMAVVRRLLNHFDDSYLIAYTSKE